MKFNADLLKKVLDAKVLPEKHGQVICAEFISFAHSQNTVTRHSAKVCPHSTETVVQTNYTIEGDVLTELRFLFTPKNLNILYVEGVSGGGHNLLKLDDTHQKLEPKQEYKKRKQWLVRNKVLYQKLPAEMDFLDSGGHNHFITNGVFDLMNAPVVGSTDSGDLWLPDHTCRHIKQTGKEYNIVVEKCSEPKKLLLSFAALKNLNATLANDEAIPNYFAMLYYGQAPTTTTKVSTTEDFYEYVFPEWIYLFTVMPTMKTTTTTASPPESFSYWWIIGVIAGLVLAAAAGFGIYKCKRKAADKQPSQAVTLEQMRRARYKKA
ncbi:unnamed protein product [Bursaphelenchus okinawaensis]|uniref:Uncharacterized protein n=1 Tax=Bursaphelenchus okinawaensis TaxID=465554 RepID=A0A811LKV4_9BILA|nr:unnamed protein product [Bursaphelenchus okinawaensis]CAG9123570.1 unnamed protein product [Bursaphelenchus okinawaensis]